MQVNEEEVLAKALKNSENTRALQPVEDKLIL
jgi:hypothetical protein